ncbi:hypothetical protein KXD96_22715 [Mycobacterium sp. SMC-2]|uniref:hypothetical protein n=1 Tax=Mycobacterium sp. SMC-2 TaxID=2857058 RepID=UPI0021B280F9|nr:hypothetical protein [Mycobacterium sp. SMC-2]UXA09616.1 hypothetical protein KXD96_22715 [Mycobacterium sp. SMC-2]
MPRADVSTTTRFPQWRPFVDAVQRRRPDAGTRCEAASDPKTLGRVRGLLSGY